MKKVISLVIFLGLCVFSFAADEDKPVEQVSPQLAAIRVANDLAKYGYKAYSASALIGAAEILATIQTQELKPEGVEKGEKTGNTGAKTEKPEFTPANLLASAKELAAGDSTLLAWAAKVEQQSAVKTRGAMGGPKRAASSVNARATDVYRIQFRGGELASVFVSGDGDTDLDLYVYDSSGNLVGKDDDYTDDCLVMWRPRYAETFTIHIRNRGNVYNQYVLATN